jgi:hypothetical protein
MIVEGLEPLKAAVFTHAPAAAGMLLPVALRLADALRVPRIRSCQCDASIPSAVAAGLSRRNIVVLNANHTNSMHGSS